MPFGARKKPGLRKPPKKTAKTEYERLTREGMAAKDRHAKKWAKIKPKKK